MLIMSLVHYSKMHRRKIMGTRRHEPPNNFIGGLRPNLGRLVYVFVKISGKCPHSQEVFQFKICSCYSLKYYGGAMAVFNQLCRIALSLRAYKNEYHRWIRTAGVHDTEIPMGPMGMGSID